MNTEAHDKFLALQGELQRRCRRLAYRRDVSRQEKLLVNTVTAGAQASRAER